MRISESSLATIEDRVIATQDKTLGPMENISALVDIVDGDVPVLISEVRRLRGVLSLVLAEADNDKCNEMDSLITCVNLAEEALGAK